MKDDLFKNTMNDIENIVSSDCPYFIEKGIHKYEGENIISCRFRFFTTDQFDIDIDHDKKKNVFYICVYIYAQRIEMDEILEIEKVYLLLKSAFLKQIKTTPTYRLHLLCSEDRFIEDLAEDTIHVFKTGRKTG